MLQNRINKQLAIFFFSYLILFLSMDRRINIYDEGLILLGSEMVLNGKIPYKDFWTMYGPAQYYVTAALFYLFKIDSIYLRLIDIFFRAIIVLAAYTIMKKQVGNKQAFRYTVLILLFLSSCGFYGFPIFPAVALSLMAILSITTGSDQPNPWRYIYSGILIGLVALFRHDMGFYSFAAISVFVLVCKTGAHQNNFLMQKPELNNLKLWGYFLLGVSAVFVPVSTQLLVNINIKTIVDSLFVIPATNYPEMRYLPFPDVFEIISTGSKTSMLVVYMPMIIFAAAIMIFIINITINIKEKTKLIITQNQIIINLLLLLMVLFFIKGLIRTHPIHIAPSILISIITLCLMYHRYEKERKLLHYILVFTLSISIVLMIPYILNGIKRTAKTLVEYHDKQSLLYLCANPILRRATCMGMDEERLELLEFIKNNTYRDETIFVGAGRHDKIFINDIDIYFLSERAPATRWFQFEPGVQTNLEVQTEIIQEFSKRYPKLIILNDAWDTYIEPNKSRFSSTVKVLDEYIYSNYNPIAQYGTYRVLARVRPDGK